MAGMFGVDVDPNDIIEGLKGVRDFEGKDESEHTWSYQRQKDSLELFNMDILICDNVDAIFAKYRPGTFLPALCHVFMDTNAPLDVLESAARAITYFLDVHVDSTARKVVEVAGAVKAFCKALVIFPLTDNTDPDSVRLSRDVSEQSVKVLELLCRREAKAVFEAEGLQCLLSFVSTNASTLHRDTLQCSLSVASMLCGRLKPDHAALPTCLASLTSFLEHSDTVVVDYALESLGSLVDMFSRAGADMGPLNEYGLIKGLFKLLVALDEDLEQEGSHRTLNVVNLLLALSHGSPTLAKVVFDEPIIKAIQTVLQRQEEEKTTLAVLKFVDFVLTMVFRGYEELKPLNAREDRCVGDDGQGKDLGAIDAIRNGSLEALIEAVEAGANVNFCDHFGQTVLVWAAYTGTGDMAEYLIKNGAETNLGRNPPLHYAARFGRPQMVKLLLKFGADPTKVDAEGKTALDQARQASSTGKEGRYDEVVKMLEEAQQTARTFAPPPDVEEEEEISSSPRGDPETAISFSARLLPVLVRAYQGTMRPSIRKSSLSLISKMVSLCSPSILERLIPRCANEWGTDEGPPSLTASPARTPPRIRKSHSYVTKEFGKVLVDFLGMILAGDEEEGLLRMGVKVVKDVMRMCPTGFFQMLLREGIVSHVEAFARGADSGNVSELAIQSKDVVDRFFNTHTQAPVGIVGELKSISDRMCRLFLPGLNGLSHSHFESVLVDLRGYLEQESTASPFELENAGVIEALLVLLMYRGKETSSPLTDPLQARRKMFVHCFSQQNNCDQSTPLVNLMRKLQAILASIERLPVYSHGANGGGFNNLESLKRPIRLQLRRAPGEETLKDFTGKTLKVEPLVTCDIVQQFLGSKIEPEWHDADRKDLHFVKRLQRLQAPMVLEQSFDFDTNGLLYWIGSNAHTTEWVNPVRCGLICVTSSDGRTLPYGQLEDVVSREAEPRNCHTKDRPDSWFAFDLGVTIIPSAYTLRHSRGYGRSALRNWEFQVSKDGVAWTTLRSHQADASLVEPGSTCTWTLQSGEESEGWRHIRVKQNGRNCAGKNYFSLSGFEIYGSVTTVTTERPGRLLIVEDPARQQARRQVHKFIDGARVIRGHDWKWDNQDGGDGYEGTVQGEISADGWVYVRWDHGESNRYRMGAQNSYDLRLADESAPSPQDSDGEEHAEAEVMHASVQCDGCEMFPLVGPRYKCVVCRDYDLCEECYLDDVHAEEGHTFYVIRRPGGPRRMVPARVSPLRTTTVVAERPPAWDPQVVLKREFTSLVQAFDPRRGMRTGAEQPATLDIPEPGASQNQALAADSSNENALEESRGHTDLSLFISIPPTVSSDRISCNVAPIGRTEVLEPGTSIYKAAHRMLLSASGGANASSTSSDGISKIWDTVFTVTYRRRKPYDSEMTGGQPPWSVEFVEDQIGGDKLPKIQVIMCMQERAPLEWLRQWKLSGDLKRVAKTNNCNRVSAAYRAFCGAQQVSKASGSSERAPTQKRGSVTTPPAAERQQDLVKTFLEKEGFTDKVRAILQIIKVVHDMCTDSSSLDSAQSSAQAPLPAVTEELMSEKLTNKLRQQITDPLFVTSYAVPDWCHDLVTNFAPAFPFDVRYQYFTSTSFGVDRAVASIQNAQDRSPERIRQRANARTREEDTTRSMGHLKQERVIVKRGEQILEWAMNVMRVHAKRKAILEVSFSGEEGHGTGVTNEFYSLVSDALQNKETGMWICDDSGGEILTKKNNAKKDVASSNIENLAAAQESVKYIVRDCGLFPAPLPVNAPKRGEILERYKFLGTFLAKAMLDNRLVSLPLSYPFFKLLCNYPLSLFDLAAIDPDKARHLAQLHEVAAWKQAADRIEEPAERSKELALLPDVENYCLTMEYAPSSTIHGFASHELVPGGSNVAVTLDNVGEYVELMCRFMLDEGIQAQMEAVRAGISEVFPQEQLQALTPTELQNILLGDAAVNWTQEELLENLEPRNGYDKNSATFQQFVNVLCDLQDHERKDFLRFATGVRVLPPGGLKNLDPKLTVVRKVCEPGTDPDTHFPSANTCFHFVKLPEYSSQDQMVEKLRAALSHGMGGFFFN